MPEVQRLRAEYAVDGIVDVPQPRLSWQVASACPDWVQIAAQLRVLRSGHWQEAEVLSGPDQVLVSWPFAPLDSREQVAVAVRVWGPDGPSDWSEPVWLEAGLLERADWRARMIRPTCHVDDGCSYLRVEFDAAQVVRARLYATAQGVYDCLLNGSNVGADRLAPGWTSYTNRLRYQVHDVTALLRVGANVLAARLADGWFAGRLGWWHGGLRHLYGERVGLLAQLELTMADGSTRVIGTDQSWRCGRGGIVSTSFYDGETFVQDEEPDGWERPGFDDSGWSAVDVDDLPKAALVGPQFPAIQVVDSLPVARWLTSPSGQVIADFGQVVTGHLKLSLAGAPGSTVTIRVAEVLDAGELAVRPQRTAANTDRVVLGLPGRLEWAPVFAVRSFRYAQLEDPAAIVDRGAVRAQLLRNALARTGWFRCSDDELNRLAENAAWGIADNMLDVPTDCMLRDERLGWIGDAAHVAPTAAFLYDTGGWHASWLADLALDQRPNGSPTMVVPAIPLEPFPGDYPVAVFSDAACMAPDAVYRQFGDLAMLRHQLPSMIGWARCASAEVLDGFPSPGFQFGDWLDPTAPPDNPENGLTEYDVVMALGAVRSVRLALDAARALDDTDAITELTGLLERLLTEVDHRYVTAAGLIASDSQTGYALALATDALPEDKRAGAFARLVELLRRRGRLQAGYPGTFALMDVLVDYGRADLAHRLLSATEVPSWRYAVRQGATTFWERWDSLLADGSLNPGDMLSFNHPVFCSIVDWMRRRIGGLAPAAPGYRRIRVAPLPGGGVTWAKTVHECPYGRIEVAWTLDETRFELTLIVPPGTVAEVMLPGEDAVRTAGSGTHRYELPAERVPRDNDRGRWGVHEHVAAAPEPADGR